jgi:hypothetical protein
MNVYDLMAIVIAPCETCRAEKDKPCINNSGRPTCSTHWLRKAAVQRWKKGNEIVYRQFRAECAARLLPEYGVSGCD